MRFIQRLHWQTVWILPTLSLLLASTLAAQSQPRTLTVASNPPGTVFYALASGLAKFASEGAPRSKWLFSRTRARARSCRCSTPARLTSASTMPSIWHSLIRDPNVSRSAAATRSSTRPTFA